MRANGVSYVVATILLIALTVGTIGGILSIKWLLSMPPPIVLIGVRNVFSPGYDSVGEPATSSTTFEFVHQGGDLLEAEDLSVRVEGVIVNLLTRAEREVNYVADISTTGTFASASEMMGEWGDNVWVLVQSETIGVGTFTVTFDFGHVGADVRFTSIDWVSIIHKPTNFLLLSMDELPGLRSTIAWWSTDWPRRAALRINNSTNPNALTDYQVRIEVPYDGDMRGDFGDLRFVDSSELDYWVENYNAGENAVVWVEVPNIPASDNKTIHIYYGNPDAETVSDFDGTFTKDYGESGLVGLWHMDDGSGTVVSDSSGNANHGSTHNFEAGYGWTENDGGQWDSRSDVKFSTGSALRFDGIDDYVEVLHDNSMEGMSELTVEAWVYPENGGGDSSQYVLFNGWASGLLRSAQYSIYIVPGGTPANLVIIELAVSTNGGSFSSGWFTNVGIDSNAWTHLAFTWENTNDTIKLFINGEFKNSTRFAGNSITNYGSSLYMGDTGDGYGNFNGIIDEARIYSRALTGGEIKSHYERRKPAMMIVPVSFSRATGENVLVVVNDNSPSSVEVGEYYRQKRSVPDTNIVHVNSTTDVVIPYDDYLRDIRDPVVDHLTANNLKDSILFILMTYGTPYKIDLQEGSNRIRSLDSYLSDPFDAVPYLTNEYYDAQNQFRREYGYKGYLVTRLDGPTVLLAENLVDKALFGEENLATSSGKGYFDKRGLPPGPYYSGDAAVQGAYDNSVAAGYESVLDENPEEFGTPPALEWCLDALWYWGWYSLNNYNDAFDWVDGAIGAHIDSYSAGDIRNGPSWVAGAVQKGITATVGAVAEPYLGAYTRGDKFFEHLFEGYTFAESAYRATPQGDWMMLMVGDPLYTPIVGGGEQPPVWVLSEPTVNVGGEELW